MENNDDDVSETSEVVLATFGTPHLLVKILEYAIEQKREELYIIGTRSRQGDLKGFLNLRLVNHQFDQAVCANVRIEFRKIEVDVDNHFIRCNRFTIGTHQKPADLPRRNQNENRNQNQNDLDQENENQNENENDNEHVEGAQEDFIEEMIGPEDLPSEDSLDALFLQNFFQWLANTFEPIVEQFTIYDSWSFKPCSLPGTWTNRLTIFHSMHPDMQYCNCEQCIQTARNCHKYFGPMSFQMAQDALIGQNLFYEGLSFTDAVLADIALHYTLVVEEHRTFEADRFIHDFGGIRCEEILLAVQTLASYRDEHPKPQPLEVIQLILKLWEVKAVEFEVIRFMENDYYIQRCAWEETEVFHKAYFASFSLNEFSDIAHVVPYIEAGSLDRELRHECLPIFDLRIDPCESPFRMSSNLSLLSLASQNNDHENTSWIYQGRIAFNMFRTNRIMFVSSGIVDFRGTVGTADWLKFTLRDMMRCTWGPRTRNVSETGKTVYWVHFMDDTSECFIQVWKTHAQQLLEANFPHLSIRLNTVEAFEECDNRRIPAYNSTKRPDVQKDSANSFYCSLHDTVRNNSTHIKLVPVEF